MIRDLYIAEATFFAEVRCMFCSCLLGHKPGFAAPGLVTHGIGDCCRNWAMDSGWLEKQL